jgi:ABC-type transport system involved in multi-copper enzyme maturation permease subunit
MAIYEQGYRPYLGERESLRTRPFVIAQQALRAAWRRRGVKAIFIGALLVLLGSAIFLYLGWRAMATIADNPGKGGGFGGGGVLGDIMREPSQGFAMLYQGTLLYEGIWVFVLAMSVLCGLVAHDRRSGAIPLYLTRAISREQYLYGKLLASGTLCALILVVPCLIMAILDYGFSLPGMGSDALWRGGSAILVGLLWGAVISTTVIAVSTLTARPRLAAVFCAAAAFIPLIGVGILIDMLKDDAAIFTILSPLMLALQSADILLGIERGFGTEFPGMDGAAPIVFLLLWTLALFAFARWRIRVLGDVRE